MIIRPARPEDAASIATIQNPVIRDTAITFNSIEKTSTDIVNSIEKAKCFLVAEAGGQIVGFALYDQFRNGVGYQRTPEHTIVPGTDIDGKVKAFVLRPLLCLAHRDASLHDHRACGSIDFFDRGHPFE